MKKGILLYTTITYWLIQVVLIFMFNDSKVPQIGSVILFILCVLKLFLENKNYDVLFSLVLTLYSLVFAVATLFLYVFLDQSHTLSFVAIIGIAIINLILAISLLISSLKTIKQDKTN